METRRTLLVDAFADEPLAGNVAGVVPDVGELSEDRMGRIAAELGASETAFLLTTPARAPTSGSGISLPQPRSICVATPRSRLTAPCSPRAIDAGDPPSGPTSAISKSRSTTTEPSGCVRTRRRST